MTQVVEHLPSKCKTPEFKPQYHKKKKKKKKKKNHHHSIRRAHNNTPQTWGWFPQGYPSLDVVASLWQRPHPSPDLKIFLMCQANLGYRMRPSLK
jgi:hypothetical protein